MTNVEENTMQGRKRTSGLRLVTVPAATDTVITFASPKRVSLILGSASGGAILISDVAMTAAGQGIFLPAGTLPFRADVWTNGQIVTKELHCWSVAGDTVAVFETFDDYN